MTITKVSEQEYLVDTAMVWPYKKSLYCWSCFSFTCEHAQALYIHLRNIEADERAKKEDTMSDNKRIAMEAVYEGLEILFHADELTGKTWAKSSVSLHKLDRLAKQLGYPDANAVYDKMWREKQINTDVLWYFRHG